MDGHRFFDRGIDDPMIRRSSGEDPRPLSSPKSLETDAPKEPEALDIDMLPVEREEDVEAQQKLAAAREAYLAQEKVLQKGAPKQESAKGKGSLLGRLFSSSQGKVDEEMEALAYEEALKAKQTYEEMRAEVVGGRVDRFLAERNALADARLKEFEEGKDPVKQKIYRAYKKMGEWNLGALMQKFDATKDVYNKQGVIGKAAINFVSVRSAVSFGLLGTGLLVGAGAAAAAAGAFGARRLLSGFGATIGSYDAMRLVSKVTLERTIRKKHATKDSEGKETLNTGDMSAKEMLELIEKIEAQAMMNAKKPEDYAWYTDLVSAYEQKTKKEAETKGDRVQEWLAAQIADADAVSEAKRSETTKNNRIMKAASVALGVTVGSGALASGIRKAVEVGRDGIWAGLSAIDNGSIEHAFGAAHKTGKQILAGLMSETKKVLEDPSRLFMGTAHAQDVAAPVADAATASAPDAAAVAEVAAPPVEATALQLGTVRGGDGVTNCFYRQIQVDPSKFGYTGDTSDADAVDRWIRNRCKEIAENHALLREDGAVWIDSKGIGNISFVLEGDPRNPDVVIADAHTGVRLGMAHVLKEGQVYDVTAEQELAAEERMRGGSGNGEEAEPPPPPPRPAVLRVEPPPAAAPQPRGPVFVEPDGALAPGAGHEPPPPPPEIAPQPVRAPEPPPEPATAQPRGLDLQEALARPPEGMDDDLDDFDLSPESPPEPPPHAPPPESPAAAAAPRHGETAPPPEDRVPQVDDGLDEDEIEEPAPEPARTTAASQSLEHTPAFTEGRPLFERMRSDWRFKDIGLSFNNEGTIIFTPKGHNPIHVRFNGFNKEFYATEDVGLRDFTIPLSGDELNKPDALLQRLWKEFGDKRIVALYEAEMKDGQPAVWRGENGHLARLPGYRATPQEWEAIDYRFRALGLNPASIRFEDAPFLSDTLSPEENANIPMKNADMPQKEIAHFLNHLHSEPDALVNAQAHLVSFDLIRADGVPHSWQFFLYGVHGSGDIINQTRRFIEARVAEGFTVAPEASDSVRVSAEGAPRLTFSLAQQDEKPLFQNKAEQLLEETLTEQFRMRGIESARVLGWSNRSELMPDTIRLSVAFEHGGKGSFVEVYDLSNDDTADDNVPKLMDQLVEKLPPIDPARIPKGIDIKSFAGSVAVTHSHLEAFQSILGTYTIEKGVVRIFTESDALGPKVRVTVIVEKDGKVYEKTFHHHTQNPAQGLEHIGAQVKTWLVVTLPLSETGSAPPAAAPERVIPGVLPPLPEPPQAAPALGGSLEGRLQPAMAVAEPAPPAAAEPSMEDPHMREMAAAILRGSPWGTEANFQQFLGEVQRITDPGEQVRLISEKFLGTKYEGDTLSKRTEVEKMIVKLDGVDCFTLLDYVEAMRRANSFVEFIQALKQVRYDGAQVGYFTRNHFFTDWDKGRSGAVAQNVTAAVGENDVIAQNKRLKVGGIIRGEKRLISYLPYERLNDPAVLGRLRTGDYVGIGSPKANLDVTHTGILIQKSDGWYLRHAASKHGKGVVDEKLADYIATRVPKGSPGLVILRPRALEAIQEEQETIARMRERARTEEQLGGE